MGAAILGDWGTTRLRLFRRVGGETVGRIDGPGIGALDAPAADVLADRLAPWRAEGETGPVVLCGMAGARGGLVEAAYVDCPTDAAGWCDRAVKVAVGDGDVSVLPGLRTRNAVGVPDVMRGEETQIFGAIALDPALGHGRWTFVLPGTHSKWVTVDHGVIRGFRTYPTGELFALLADRSTLAGGNDAGDGSMEQGFARGLERSGEATLGALFEARAARMVDGRSAEWARGYLSGLLIGGEVAAEAGGYNDVVLIGDPALAGHYAQALAKAGCGVHVMDGDACVLAGLELAQGEAA